MASRNTTGKTTALVRQRHGGALATGGTPGNRGGTGRPKDSIRASMRDSLEARIGIAEAIADDPKSSNSDRLKALEFFARYGIGTAEAVPTIDIGQLHINALRHRNAARTTERALP
jgi:hypothetical protein